MCCFTPTASLSFRLNMAGLWTFTQSLLVVFAASTLALDFNRITVPKSPGVAGVFMLTEGGSYAFDFADAAAACRFLNVTIATKAQMEQALTNGLETCKFGWIAEQVAVVPRLAPVKTCGNGKTGVVSWNAKPQQRFGVFCFNASETEETKSSTSVPRTSTSSSTSVLLTQRPTTPVVRSTTDAEPSTTMKMTMKTTTKRTRVTSAFTSTMKTTHPAEIPFTSPSPKPVSSRSSAPRPRLLTSLPADVTSTSTVRSFASSSVNPARPRFGVLSTALVVVCVVVLLVLTAGGAVFYYKWSVFPMWPREQQKDEVETEMWKQTGSETDLHEEEEEEEEEADRKYASDATLCVSPDVKTKC